MQQAYQEHLGPQSLIGVPDKLVAVNNATSLSGTPINDCGPSTFKTSIESEIQSVSNGSKSVDDFLKTIGDSCK